MVELSRTVRFCVGGGDAARRTPRANTHAAWPAMTGLGRYYELTVACRGEPDAQTGYCVDIRAIDRAVRDGVLPMLETYVSQDAADAPMGEVMRRVLAGLRDTLGAIVHAAQLRLTPTVSLTMNADLTDTVTVSQRYEFSAAHRLHAPGMSDEENRAVFGKCNNPAGHGHNYRLEVAVRLPIDPSGHVAPVHRLDELVDAAVIDKLDHKHLNVDVPAFADLNPSVEHIAAVIWGELAGRVGELAEGAALDAVSVWETEKTVCTYRGPGGGGSGV